MHILPSVIAQVHPAVHDWDKRTPATWQGKVDKSSTLCKHALTEFSQYFALGDGTVKMHISIGI